MRHGLRKRLPALLILLLVTAAQRELILERSRASVLKTDTCCRESFRLQELSPALYERIRNLSAENGTFGDILTATMLNGNFSPTEISSENQYFLKYKPEAYQFLKECYEAIWADLVYFPIPAPGISYEDSFGLPRYFGGERSHEGTDLMGEITEPGYYPVVSMTDGVVENIGWLPLGGYRIGIRAPEGGYFYYAHFSEYEKDFAIGEAVAAGDILGYMGNTGYGPEGTCGQFPVHLHLGIYIRTPEKEELSVNPYWILKAVEGNSLLVTS